MPGQELRGHRHPAHVHAYRRAGHLGTHTEQVGRRQGCRDSTSQSPMLSARCVFTPYAPRNHGLPRSPEQSGAMTKPVTPQRGGEAQRRRRVLNLLSATAQHRARLSSANTASSSPLSPAPRGWQRGAGLARIPGTTTCAHLQGTTSVDRTWTKPLAPLSENSEAGGTRDGRGARCPRAGKSRLTWAQWALRTLVSLLSALQD